jgi:hypothetical protein
MSQSPVLTQQPSTALKAAAVRKSVFSTVRLPGVTNGAELLITGGVNQLYHLVCEGEDVGVNGTSWGFVFAEDKIMLA